jgi:hypothetical protein
MENLEKEYYLLSPSDIENYPFIYEDCSRLSCSYEQYQKCEKVPDCPAYYMKKTKIENPRPFVMDFFTVFTKKEAVYADCYMPLSLAQSSFVVSPKLYSILNNIKIEGIQYIPVTLLEDNQPKYTDFIYAHTYNYLSVLSVKKSRFQEHNGIEISNNLLEIKFNNKILSKIPLVNRLIFRFPLMRTYFIFHQSIVEKILPINPIGVQFIQL